MTFRCNCAWPMKPVCRLDEWFHHRNRTVRWLCDWHDRHVLGER